MICHTTEQALVQPVTTSIHTTDFMVITTMELQLFRLYMRKIRKGQFVSILSFITCIYTMLMCLI